jgi:Domain of unknown function (DUF4124)
MLTRHVGQIFVTAIALFAVCAGAYAETTVYRWVDEDGVVHFSDAPPAESSPVETETITIEKTPPNVTPARPVANPAVVSRAADDVRSKQPEAEIPPLFEKIDITKMSVADLDLRCDEAREKMIAPLRDAEIAKCKQDKREDPAFCEQFNADYGDGGRTMNGSIRPRMFDDLPECVEALQEENRRGR